MMSRLTPLVLFLAAMAAPATLASPPADPQSLIVHEWGTFTSVAGEDGEAVDWWSLGGAQDLPCFVDRFREFPKGFARATVRMETPVLYFYAPQDTTVDVSVKFRQGMITEWFPRALLTPKTLTSPSAFTAPGFTHTLAWSNVRVSPRAPEEYPREDRPSHYYAARDTDAAPLQRGTQKEKFLFYRGVGHFSIPVTATVAENGKIVIRNTGRDPLSRIVLFENRGGRIGYRVRPAVNGRIALDPPALTSDLRSLSADLEKILISEGLYPKEAKAMVQTWRDSWFEEGTRIFYIVPPKLVDDVLPLTIEPRPSRVARVFVGRVELITAATRRDVADAIAANNPQTAAKYGRFLPSIVDRLFPVASTSRAERSRADSVLQSVYASLANGTSCASSVAH